jgi:hypothetical protein
MGLSFHYSGEIRDKKKLPELIDEVKTFAETHKWPHKVFDSCFSDTTTYVPDIKSNLYGITFSPPECENVDVCFLESGKMSNLINQMIWSNPENAEEEKYLYMMSVKTQFAGIEVHTGLIDFFRHINIKYLKNFKLIDEGLYWETSDMKATKAQFDRYNDIFDTFELALKSIPPNSSENLLDYIERIAQRTDKYLKDNRNEDPS